ncbi:hypothetical protein CUMW_024730 [Citrus unshiu]|nr:hypothetical protein CUMW_024730 [Citrus unshiu]
MEFDKALVNPWETDYQMTVKKYTETGYGAVVPQRVFWNLTNSKSTSWIYKEFAHFLFMDNEGGTNPELVTEAVISGEEYQKLIVLD